MAGPLWRKNMPEPSINWNQEFLSGNWDVARELGSNSDWRFYEIEGERFGVFGIGFSEAARTAFVRFTFDCPERPQDDAIIEWMKRVRFSMDPRDELRFAPEVGYDVAGSGLVIKLRTVVNVGESLNSTLSMMLEKMYKAMEAVLAE